MHRGNIAQLEAMYALLGDMDIYSWRVVSVDPIGRAAGRSAMLLNVAELKLLFEFIRNKRYSPENEMPVSYGCSHFVTWEYENEIRDYYFQCGAGTPVAGVMANGDIGACLDIERREELIQGNACVDDFVDVWEHRFAAFRMDRTELSATCSGCDFRAVCMGDSAHTWDYDCNEPNYCVARMLEEG